MNPSQTVTPPLAGTTLLVVEDSRVTCDALRLMIGRAGGRLRRVDTLAVAARYLARHTPDLALVDLGLPDGDGAGLIRALAGSGTPVLGISGDPAARRTALWAGAAGFVEKPLPPYGATLALILRHLHRPPAVVRGVGCATPDPLALTDDLAYAARLLDTAEAGTQAYVARFLSGVARSVGDAPLLTAAGAVQRGGTAALRRVLAQRLATPPAAFSRDQAGP